MISLGKLLSGYYVFKIDGEEVAKCAELFLLSGISVKFSRNASFSVHYGDKEKITALLDGKIKYTVSEPLGLFGAALRLGQRYGILSAMLIVSVLAFVLFGRVWDVRIEGSLAGNDEQILRELSASGLYVGRSWGEIDKSAVENTMLSLSDNVSWVNINRRGAVAYVTVVDKVIHEKEEPPIGYANILAERDCVIEEITVRRGVPLVKVGDTVRRGDVLISGVIPSELGGGFCYADGEVRGRYTDSEEVRVSSLYEYEDKCEAELQSISFNFFHFSINIFKKYGNLPEGCDIIEENHKITLSGNKTAPISFLCVYSQASALKSRTLSEDEMAKIASQRLKQTLADSLSGKDLLSISTVGEFVGGEYIMKSEFVCRAVVGKTKEFEFSLE